MFVSDFISPGHFSQTTSKLSGRGVLTMEHFTKYGDYTSGYFVLDGSCGDLPCVYCPA